MPVTKHGFTEKLVQIVSEKAGCNGQEALEKSSLLQYLNIKTKAANKSSKSRAGIANHYALYVLIEDYLANDFDRNLKYADYDGAQFSNLFRRQRELPFGSKLQNHALNHRLNEEFRKYFPSEDALPIIRDVSLNRYWINERLIKISVGGQPVNLASSVLEIVKSYVAVRMASFNSFMDECAQLLKIEEKDISSAIEFIKQLLRPNVDARVFEIVSYAILKQHYAEKILFWGWSPEELKEEKLSLFKTGRTNANDGGIDFVMRPLGRFFQVTETVDAGKYFLDIDKVQRYPITFVVKTEESPETLKEKLRIQANEKYGINRVVDRYIECVEEIINVPMLVSKFDEIVSDEKIRQVIEEIILQSRVEFNVEEENSGILAFDLSSGDVDSRADDSSSL
ncbi:MAG: hypothetical protein ACPGOV_02455 [Magnetovibrionaceae bacterium]